MSGFNLIAPSTGRITTGETRSPFAAVPAYLRKAMASAWRKHKTRRMLGDMDERMLSDLGISRGQANFEASRWMWD